MRHWIVLTAASAAGLVNALALAAESKSTVAFKAEDEKTFYAIGAALGRNVAPFNLTPAELELVKAGFSDMAQHRTPALEFSEFIPKIQELQAARIAVTAAAEKKAGEAYLAKAAAVKGAQKTASGLVYTPIKVGTGASPKETDTVKVHYHGTLPSGKVFDSSVERKEPATFPLNGVIPCWTEGVKLMKVGGKSRLVCPSSIAYGDGGQPPDILPGATLVFEVELLGIEPAPAAAPAPKQP